MAGQSFRTHPNCRRQKYATIATTNNNAKNSNNSQEKAETEVCVWKIFDFEGRCVGTKKNKEEGSKVFEAEIEVGRLVSKESQKEGVVVGTVTRKGG